MTGDTPDISHLVELGFYDFVWFWDPGQTTIKKRRLGKYMGSTRDVGEVMCANVLTDKGMVIARTSLWPITYEERRSEVVKDQMKKFKVDLRIHVANDGPLRLV